METLVRSITQLPNFIPTQNELAINTTFIIQCIFFLVLMLVSKFFVRESIHCERDFLFDPVEWTQSKRTWFVFECNLKEKHRILNDFLYRIAHRSLFLHIYIFLFFACWCSCAVKFQIKWRTHGLYRERNVLNRPNWLFITLVAKVLHLNYVKWTFKMHSEHRIHYSSIPISWSNEIPSRLWIDIIPKEIPSLLNH